MVMEYLAGSDLAARLHETGPLSVEQAVEFILQAGEAIAEAHALGIVHRDLKPSNLFCIERADGVPAIKVLDFGISKILGPDQSGTDAHKTKTSAVFGSPLYMSPEQMLSTRDVDERTDIWALGAILYELLTGKSAFDGTSLPEIFARVSTMPPAAVRDHRPDVPLDLETVILKCLEKDRTLRYSNVAELARALGKFASKRAKPSVDRISRVISTAALPYDRTVASSPPHELRADTAQSTDANWGRTDTGTMRGSRTKAIAIGGTVALVLGVGVGAFVFRAGPRDSSGVAQPSASVFAVTDQSRTPAEASAPPKPSASAPVMEAPPVPSEYATAPQARPSTRGFAKPQRQVTSATIAKSSSPPSNTPAPQPGRRDLLRQQY
jgi:serine/threonine-protein kinase